jgi:hypothetical protein
LALERLEQEIDGRAERARGRQPHGEERSRVAALEQSLREADRVVKTGRNEAVEQPPRK